MKHFRRVIRVLFKQKLTLIGVGVASLFIALTWGANIGTVYPMFEIVLRGESLQDWANEQLALPRFQVDGNLVSSDATAGDFDAHAKSWSRWGLTQLSQHAPADALTTLYWIVGWIVVASAARFAAVLVHSIFVTRIVGEATNVLRREFFHKTLAMDLKAFHQYRVADLINHVNHDLGLISNGIGTIIGHTITEPMKIIVCLTGAALISWKLLVLLMVTVPPGMFAMHFVAKSIQSSSHQISGHVADVCRRLHLSFLSIQLIKSYNLETYQEEKLNVTADNLLRRTLQHNLIQQSAKLVSEGFVIGVTSIALIVGGTLVIQQSTHIGGISILSKPVSAGAMIAFFAFLLGTHQPIRRLSDLFSSLQNSEAAARRFFELVDRPAEITSPACPQPLPTGPATIKFENVNFAYSSDQQVLKNINLSVKPGEILALVGANGSGKSTLINMLSRFYDPESGRITIGGVDLRDASLEELRSRIGLVTQSTILFDDSVEQNIRCGRPDASHAEVAAAAKRAQAHEFITKSLASGYDTNVGEQGKRLSGGQCQRVALARAILRNPDILILDEPTSAVDMESEFEIHAALQKFMSDRITILITHHQPSLELATRIAVLDQGSLVDVGTHDELIRRCDTYCQLFRLPNHKAA